MPFPLWEQEAEGSNPSTPKTYDRGGPENHGAVQKPAACVYRDESGEIRITGAPERVRDFARRMLEGDRVIYAWTWTTQRGEGE